MEKASLNGACDTWLATFKRFNQYARKTLYSQWVACIEEGIFAMNYYKRHIGDYLKDTAHLTLLEHGVYARLLDVYYTREGPIPDDQAARLIGARTKEERDALAAVLLEFFEAADGSVWVQPRCERELAAKEAKAETNRVNGARGGRPKKQTHSEPNNNPQKTQTVSGINPAETHGETQAEPTENPSHKPLANSHNKTQVSNSSGNATTVGTSTAQPPLPEPSQQVKRIGLVCRLLRSRGVQCNPSQFQGKYAGLENHSDDDFHLAIQTLLGRGESRIGIGLVAAVLGDMDEAKINPGQPARARQHKQTLTEQNREAAERARERLFGPASEKEIQQ